MVEIKDDPREVLELLNSLGFVGITAPQLKAFMKDLKMYRKVKEHERQRRKEEMKKKILSKQQSMVREILCEHQKEFSSGNRHRVFSDSTNFDSDDSVVEVKIKCIPKERKGQGKNYPKKSDALPSNVRTHGFDSTVNFSSKRFEQHNLSHVDGKSKSSFKRSKSEERHKTVSKSFESTRQVSSDRHEYYETQRSQQHKNVVKLLTPPARDTGANTHHLKSIMSSHKRPESAPNAIRRRPRSKSVTSDRSGSASTSSVPPTRASSQSGSKSFIRPWRLQPDAQKGSTGIKKCDPVTLYQKYQQEWKQVSFPGEEKHASIRWAVREKMLGFDPQPMPLPKKSTSMPVLKRK